MSISFDLDGVELFRKYPGQNSPQDAYVYMDKDGVVSAEYNPCIGGGMTMDEWHGRTLRWEIPPETDPEALADFLQSSEIASLLETIYNGHSVEWDGNNFVGRLDEEAQEASDKLQDALDDFCEQYQLEYWDIDVFLGDTDVFEELHKSESLEAIYERLVEEAEENDILFEGNDWYNLDSLKYRALKGLEKRLDEDEIGIDAFEEAADVAIKIYQYDKDKAPIGMVVERLEAEMDEMDEMDDTDDAEYSSMMALMHRLKGVLPDMKMG